MPPLVDAAVPSTAVPVVVVVNAAWVVSDWPYRAAPVRPNVSGMSTPPVTFDDGAAVTFSASPIHTDEPSENPAGATDTGDEVDDVNSVTIESQ